MLLALFVNLSASASTVTFGTGMSGAIGDYDSLVDLIAGPTDGLPSHPYIVQPYPYSVIWNDPLSDTQWISPGLASNGIDVTPMAPGTYVYNLHFYLPEDFSNAELNVQYYTDNDMNYITLNGNPISFTASPQVTMGQGETSNSTFFKVGDNILTIGVINWSNDWNPTGVDLKGTVTYVPEPVTISLLILGGIGFLRRRNS
jgi:hypothetical protein